MQKTIPQQGTATNTPLRNLFAYVRDLYNSAEPVYRFTDEPNNRKTKNVNYWELAKMLDIHQLFRQKTTRSTATDSENDIVVLRLKRSSVPELIKPTLLEDWLIITDNDETIPTLSVKKEIERTNILFEDSPQRVQAFNRFANEILKSNGTDDITIPDILKGWVKIDRKDDNTVTAEKIAAGTEKETFDGNKERITKYNKYEKYFADYYKDNWDNIRINRLYDALHQLHYELKGSDSKKLYLSFGLVSGKIGGMEYQNFLFHVPLGMTLKNQEIRIEYDTFANRIFCEQHFSELLDEHFKHESTYSIEQKRNEVLQNADYFNSQPVEFYLDDAFIRSNYYETALKITGVFSQIKKIFFNDSNELDYNFYSKTDAQKIILSFSPVIQTRYVASQIAISKDATNIIQKINELEGNRQLQLIPDFFRKMFTVNETASYQNGYTAATAIQHDEGTISTNQRFFFPLPYNEEQLTIAKRLTTQDAVTVKGPPGTGKSHTIANLISHFVALGKSILVISHNAKALTVLKEKLPGQIQDLAISLVNENKGNETLKASVNSIVSHLAQQYDESKIKQMQEELDELERQSASVKENIYSAIQANTGKLNIINPILQSEETAAAYEWARIFVNLSKPAVVIDKIHYKTDTTNLSKNITSYIKKAQDFTHQDFDLVQYNFQEEEKFLPGAEFKKMEQRIQEIMQLISPADYSKTDYRNYDDHLKSAIENFLQLTDELQQLSVAPQLLKTPGFNRQLLKRLLAENETNRNGIKTWNEQLLNYSFDFTSIKDTDPEILHKQITELIGKFENSNTLSFLSKKMLGRELKKFFECKINAITANELTHFRIIEKAVHRDKKIKQLNITFRNYISNFGLNYLTDMMPVLDELIFADTFLGNIDQLNRLLEEKKLPPLKYGSSDFNNRLEYLQKLGEYAAYKAITELLQVRKKEMIDHVKPHPLIQQMADALDAVDRVKYEQLLEEYRQLRNKQAEVMTANELHDQITALVPQTARKIKADIISHSGVHHITADVIENDLYYHKIESFLKQVTQQTTGTESLFEKLQTIKANIESKIAEVVAYRSWYYKTKQVDDTQKSALNAWLNDLINIGKGYGKNTARNMQSAIQNMQIAKGAVPIWIMQQASAISFFPDVSPGQFDLLIIDEASQCDISSLNLIFRCRKSIIVGDENQTSVSVDSMEFPVEKTNQALDRYLISHPFKQQFNINNKNNSIYTLSGVIYPNIVVLKEHFRCLPEIIGFSNKYIYNRDIIPLKSVTHKLYGDPLEIHCITDDVADESKPQIVSKVVNKIEEYIAAYEQGAFQQLPTIGVITLDSSNIKHQNQLIKQFAASELIKKYEDKLALLLGTSREFQGDERDIMILTVTASHSQNEKGEVRPPRAVTGEEFMRIYNVAASRAKEKSVLFHSIHPEAVALMNPDCYRKKLLDYYMTAQIKPVAVNKSLQELLRKTDATSGNLEKEVCEYLYNKGWSEYIHPQFSVGNYKIDFGIIYNGKKLAVECDGIHYTSGMDKIKEDIQRQLVLERAGWQFFRIQSTEWFYNKEQLGNRLTEWLAQNTAEV